MDFIFKTFHVIGILLEVLLIFNLLIIVHEIGHFVAAKWRGLYVDGFGIWFGKPLWKKKINGVTYSLGSIPAGGFVKLPQMVDMSTVEGEAEVKSENLPSITPLDKIIVAFAGPLFSFGLAVVFAVIVAIVGRPVSEAESATTVGYVMPGLAADDAKMRVGDKILEVDGHQVGRFGGMGSDSITWRVVRSEGKIVDVRVRHLDGTKETLHTEPEPPKKAHFWNRPGLRQLGILPAFTAVVSKVEDDSTAQKAGLMKDDRIVKINGEKLYNPAGITDYMSAHPARSYTLTVVRDGKEMDLKPLTPTGIKVEKVLDAPNSPAIVAGFKDGDVVTGIEGTEVPPVADVLTDYVENHEGKPVVFNITRDGKAQTLTVIPQIPLDSTAKVPKAMIGLQWGKGGGMGIAFDSMGIPKTDKPSPVEQIRASMMAIVNTLDAVLSPKSSIGVQQMGGPVMMMHAYYGMLDMHDGWKLALWFSVLLNVNLALLNLLPIPVLDGGHITLAIIEAIRRRPMNLKVLEVIQGACAMVIIGFMLFIVFFDVQDLPFVDKSPSIRFKAPTAEKQ